MRLSSSASWARSMIGSSRLTNAECAGCANHGSTFLKLCPGRSAEATAMLKCAAGSVKRDSSREPRFTFHVSRFVDGECFTASSLFGDADDLADREALRVGNVVDRHYLIDRDIEFQRERVEDIALLDSVFA